MEPFDLRFIRDKTNSANDDVVSISFLSPGNYQIKTNYSEAKCSIKSRCSIQTLSYIDIFYYVHSLMILLIHDSDPFMWIQIDAPNTPSILLANKDLDVERVYQAIDNLLHVTLSIWSRSLP